MLWNSAWAMNSATISSYQSSSSETAPLVKSNCRNDFSDASPANQTGASRADASVRGRLCVRHVRVGGSATSVRLPLAVGDGGDRPSARSAAVPALLRRVSFGGSRVCQEAAVRRAGDESYDGAQG